jgi:superfamily II DNA helicase RecQ
MWYLPVQWIWSGQKEAIQSFAQNLDTVVIKQTGSGKSLCFTISTLLTQGIAVVFSPLKALIDDQVMKLIKVEISCCSLYASTE